MLTLTVTFSKESGVSMAKAIKMTCDLEYDRGRKRYSFGERMPSMGM